MSEKGTIQTAPVPPGIDSARLVLKEKAMTDIEESIGRYVAEDADLDEMDAYLSGVSESVPKGAPESDFADPPSGLYIGDAKHARLAVQAVTDGLRGNKAKASTSPGVKGKIASAIRKFYSGDEQQYYLSWLHSGKKPDSKPVKEMLSFNLPPFSFLDEKSFPDVPIAPTVDVAKLTAGDSDPLFVTRPLGVLDAQSNNGLVYDENLLRDIERQAIGKVARQGHVPEANRSWQFPDDVGIWVGVLRQGGVLYGKCYVYPGTHFNLMARNRRAAGGTLANSIWGNSDLVDQADGTRRSRDLDLESIDFVPAERAALATLGGEFDLTSEMETTMTEQDKAVAELATLKKTIASLKPEDLHECLNEAGHAHKMAEMHLRAGGCSECSGSLTKEMVSESLKRSTLEETYGLLTDDQRKHCAEAFSRASGLKMVKEESVAEMTEKISEVDALKKSVAEMDALKQRMSEMETTIARYQREEFDRALDGAIARRLDWNVNTDDGKSKLKALKANLRVQVVAEMAGSTKKEDIDAGADRAWETFKPLAEITRAALAGPSAITGATTVSSNGATPFGWDPKTQRYTDEAVADATTRHNYRKPA